MTKLYSIIIILIGLITVFYLETQISETEYIISDYIESEFKRAQNNVQVFRQRNTAKELGDSTFKHILSLYNNIKLNDPYSIEQRRKISSQLNLVDYNFKNVTNVSLFNKLCKKKLHELHELEKNSNPINRTLIFEKLEHFKNDSFYLKITPIIYIKDDTSYKFYHKDKLVDQSAMNNFQGNVDDLEVRFRNPKTGKYLSIK